MSLELQVRFIFGLYACVVVNREGRPQGKNGSRIFAYERPHGHPSFTGWRALPLTILLLKVYSSQGLCAYVLKSVDNAAYRGVVVGHDHRHHSERWAALTAAAFLTKGVKAYLLRGFVHTPLYVPHYRLPPFQVSNLVCSVPFCVGTLGAACGVMITGM